jgi:preprotein translocase subunit SecF
MRGLLASVLIVYVFTWTRFNGPWPVLAGLAALCSDILGTAGMILRTWHW